MRKWVSWIWEVEEGVREPLMAGAELRGSEAPVSVSAWTTVLSCWRWNTLPGLTWACSGAGEPAQ